MQREAKKEGSNIKKLNSKLRNDTIFGESIENAINKADVKIVPTRKQHLNWSVRQTFKK